MKDIPSKGKRGPDAVRFLELRAFGPELPGPLSNHYVKYGTKNCR